MMLKDTSKYGKIFLRSMLTRTMETSASSSKYKKEKMVKDSLRVLSREELKRAQNYLLSKTSSLSRLVKIQLIPLMPSINST